VSLKFLFVEDVLHLEAVVLKSILGLDLLSDGVILSSELISIGDHLLDLFLGETTLIVSDSDLLSLTSGFICGRYVEDTIGIDIESNFDLRSTTRCRRDTFKVEFSEQVIISGHLTFTFKDLDEDTWLVISVGGESLLLLGGDASVSWDKDSHDTTSSLDTLGKRSNIQKEEILDLFGTLTGEDSGLNSGTVGDGFIRVDRSVKSLSVEEVLEHGLNLGDTGGTTDKYDLVDLGLANVSILKDLLDGRHALAELWHAKLLELGTGNVDVEVLTLSKSLAIDFRLMGTGQDSLGLLALGSETSHGTRVALDVDTALLLELGNAEVDEDIIEIFTTKMGVTIGSFDFEDTIFNGEKGHVKSTTTKIEDENVLLTLTLLVETVSNSGGSRLVDDTLDVEASDGSSILGSLSLTIIEIGWDSDDSTGDGLSEISLSDFLHLGQDHG